MQESLDSFDRKILLLLQQDASRSSSEIADLVGLSQAPCWRRIQRLKRKGYIRRQVALLDRHKVGLKAHIFAQVKLSQTGRSSLEDFTRAIREFPEVLDFFVLLGTVDFMLRIVARDIEAYETFFFDKLSRIPGVMEINSMVALSEIKSSTELPLDTV